MFILEMQLFASTDQLHFRNKILWDQSSKNVLLSIYTATDKNTLIYQIHSISVELEHRSLIWCK